MFSRGFFKGWYFKCCTRDGQTVAFIPAFHGRGSRRSASLQIITARSSYFIPFDCLQYREKPLSIRLGSCCFSDRGLILNRPEGPAPLSGSLRFQGFAPPSRDIMGPFALLPFLPCRHRICSMQHRIDGRITVGDEVFTFHNGRGYAEGDEGCSFPRRYLWSQCLFAGGSLMLAAAEIPLPGLTFMGTIAHITLNGQSYRLATYRGARIDRLTPDSPTVRQGPFVLSARLLQRCERPLQAPRQGLMSRTIYESAACRVYYRFTCRDRVLLEFAGDRASFESVGVGPSPDEEGKVF